MSVKRNWESLVLKAMGGRDFRLTVLGSEPVNSRYHRLRIDGGDLLAECGVHPTMWIRLWFDNAGKAHQRAYTLVDPDPATGEFSLEFAIHDGCAARWALAASPGDTIEATVQGSAFALPDPAPAHLYVVGDAASVPAVNSLLDAAGGVPATVWLEHAHDEEKELPLRAGPQHTTTWVQRMDDGRHLVDTVCAALPATEDGFYWVACEASSARNIARHVRRGLGIDKQRVSTLGYWTAA
jgi:NADPH-dependent ferric siderophore reductase